MSATEVTAARYYVARTDGRLDRAANLYDAVSYANHLYDNGVIAPLVVRAANADAARVKAQRCYDGEITCRQARSGG